MRIVHRKEKKVLEKTMTNLIFLLNKQNGREEMGKRIHNNRFARNYVRSPVLFLCLTDSHLSVKSTQYRMLGWRNGPG